MNEPTDDQALTLGREICGGNWWRDTYPNHLPGTAIDEIVTSIDSEQREIGRKAWALGARPTEKKT